jgi:hypothetical protein
VPKEAIHLLDKCMAIITAATIIVLKPLNIMLHVDQHTYTDKEIRNENRVAHKL